MSARPSSAELVDDYFRREYGRLVATLGRTFGFHRIDVVEDGVQSALLKALRAWAQNGVPDDAGAWLYRVARNEIVDALRGKNAQATSTSASAEVEAIAQAQAEPAADTAAFAQEVADDELRMLFVCADDAIPPESQLVLALKTLSGFGIREIALRLMTTEANVYKRLARARERMRALDPDLDSPSWEALVARRPRVLQMIYLIFNEGYGSTDPDRLVRRELCEEALRLGHLLADHAAGACPESEALLALMYLLGARLDARVDGMGGLLLLEDQDRTLWDRGLIQRGLAHLERSARGDVFSRYHAEAAVAAEHALAPSYASTRWHEICDLYSLLERLAPSPLHTLNRAIALAEWKGPRAGLDVLHAVRPPAWLRGYYLWDATLGELERRAGDLERARTHLARALKAAPTEAERALLRRRLEAAGG